MSIYFFITQIEQNLNYCQEYNYFINRILQYILFKGDFNHQDNDNKNIKYNAFMITLRYD